MSNSDRATTIKLASGLIKDISQEQFDGVLSFFKEEAIMSDWNLLPPIVENLSREIVIPQDIREKHYKLIGFQMLQKKWLHGLEEQLIRENIPVMTMKGTGLWGSLYSSLYPRISADVDLLVKPEDLDRIRLILNECATVHGHTELHTRYDLPFPYHFRVELHWDLAAFQSFNLDFERIWQRSTTHPLFDSGQIVVMSPEDTFIHTIIHSFNHRSLHNYMIVDMIRFLNQVDMDMDLVRELVVMTGSKKLTRLTFDRVQKVTGIADIGSEVQLVKTNWFLNLLYRFVFKKKRIQSPFEIQKLAQFILLDSFKSKLTNACGNYSAFMVKAIKKLTHLHQDGSTHHSS